MNRPNPGTYLPYSQIPDGHNPESWLRELTARGIASRYGSTSDDRVISRIELELGVIVARRAASFMLIVAEYVNWAKDQGILVSPGRGHVSGSVVAYVLRITDVDPVRHGLLSERFVNADVRLFPDIDLDFEQGRRREVIDHIVALYGKGCVAAIASPTDADPNRVHAAGVLITDRPTEEITAVRPLPRSDRPEWLRQVEQRSELDYIRCEQLGLSKFDLLSLIDLRTIRRTVESVAINHGVNIGPWSSDIPLDDPATFEMLCAGATDGVFQLKSPGIQKCLRRMRPVRFADIVALLSLYRPIPIEHGVLAAYIKRKNATEQAWSVDSELDLALGPILDATYGLLIYQEQLMMIAHRLAGMTLGEGDRLRRTLLKDDPRIVEAGLAEFVAGVVANGFSSASAGAMRDLLLANKRVVFQKCHSVAYGLITYTSAYLKAHYPDEFRQAADSQGLRSPHA